MWAKTMLGVAAVGFALVGARRRDKGSSTGPRGQQCTDCDALPAERELTVVADGDESATLCAACLTRRLRRAGPNLREMFSVALPAGVALLLLGMLSVVVQQLSAVGAEEPLTFGQTIARAVGVFDTHAFGADQAVGYLGAVAAVAVAVAVSLQHSSATGERLVARVGAGEPFDLELARQLLRLEVVATLQYFLVLVLTGLTGLLAVSFLLGPGPGAVVGALALVLAVWLFVECLRLKKIMTVADRARARMRAGEKIVVRSRRDRLEGMSLSAAWVLAVVSPGLGGLAAAIAVWPDNVPIRDLDGVSSDVVSLPLALVVVGYVALLVLVVGASSMLTNESRWFAVAQVGFYALVWGVSAVGSAAEAALDTEPSVLRFVVAMFVFLSVWTLVACGACGKGPMRPLARLTLGPARMSDWIDDLARERRYRSRRERGRVPTSS